MQYVFCIKTEDAGPGRGARTRGRAGAGQAPPPQASLGATCPTLEIPGQIHGVPGLVSGQLEALPAAQRTTTRFPEDHTSQWVSHRSRGRVPREDLGTWGRGGGTATVPHQVEQTRAGRTPLDLFSWGDSGLGPAWAAKILALAQTAPPCPEAAKLVPAASTL